MLVDDCDEAVAEGRVFGKAERGREAEDAGADDYD